MSHAASSTVAPRRIVLRCNSTNDDYSGDCDYALLEVTPRVVEYLRGLATIAREAWAKDHSLWELYFWGQPCELEFYSWDLVGRCQDALPPDDPDNEDWETGLENNGWQDVPKGIQLDDLEPARVQCVQTIVRMDNVSLRHPDMDTWENHVRLQVAWFCYPRHCGLGITTEGVEFSDLEEILK